MDKITNSFSRFSFRAFIYIGIASIAGLTAYIVTPPTYKEMARPFTTTVTQFGQIVLSAYDQKKPDHIQYTAWIPEWDYEEGVNAFQAHATSFTQINPVWFHLEEKNKITENKYALDTQVTGETNKYHIRLVPTIQSFDADIVHENLKSADATQQHAKEISSLVEKYDLDGIDLDYEMIYLKDKELFYMLLQILSQELHTRKKTLAIDVLSKTTDETESYNSFVETRQVQDWAILGKYVDEIRIMVYDYDNSNPLGSPINPYPWVLDVINYALTKAPAEKFILGTPLYAYSWKDGQLYKSYTYEVVKEGIEKRNARPIFDEKAKEWRVELVDEEGKQIVWYQDAKSVEYRLNLVKQYGLGGLIFWRLGGEDRGIYSLLH